MAEKTKRELIFVPAVRVLQLQEERVTLPQRMRVDTGALDARLDFYMEQFLIYMRNIAYRIKYILLLYFKIILLIK